MRTLEGLRSRWMMPFWCACCTAWQTGPNNASRSAGVRRCSSQYWVIGTPLTSSITKKGPTIVGGAAVEDLGDVRMVHQRQRLPLGLEAGNDLAAIQAWTDHLERDFAL